MSINRAFSCQAPLFPGYVCLYPTPYNAKCFEQFLLTEVFKSFVFPFFDSLLFGDLGLAQTPPKVGG